MNETDKDILDILLDEDNKDPIILVDVNGNKLTFEQVAVIPKFDKLYCILKPMDKIEHIAEDEAIVFYVDETCDPLSLLVETNEKKAVKVFLEYYDMLEEDFED